MHLLVILLQQLLGLLPNKQQAQPEPVRVRTPQPSSQEPQAFMSSTSIEGASFTIGRSATSSRVPPARQLRSSATGRRANGRYAADGTDSFPGTAARTAPPLPDCSSNGSFDPRSPEMRS